MQLKKYRGGISYTLVAYIYVYVGMSGCAKGWVQPKFGLDRTVDFGLISGQPKIMILGFRLGVSEFLYFYKKKFKG